MIVSAFRNKLFPLHSGNYYESIKEKSSESEDEIPDIGTSEQTTMLDKFYGSDLINKYFNKKSLIEIINTLKDYRKDPKTRQKYNNLTTHLIIGLRKLDRDIRKMSQDEVENRRLNYLKDLVRTIIIITNQKLDQKSEEEAAQRQQEGEGLKILTPQQMITRLPILLAQLKARNNSEKLKNEIRQLLYHLYRSKNLSKTIYNSLMNTI